MIDANVNLDEVEEDEAFDKVMEEALAEFIKLHRDGITPPVKEFSLRYPTLSDTIIDLFPTIAALEEAQKSERETAAQAATQSPLKITNLGDFEIISELGRGGMGVVYEANQKSLERRVALKVLPKQALLDPEHLKRFRSEARMAARLHHTNIVSLYGVGQHDGYHYLVMEIVEGVSLQEVIWHLRNRPKTSASCKTTISWDSPTAPAHLGPSFKSSKRPTQIIDSLYQPDSTSRLRQGSAQRQTNYFRNVTRLTRDAAVALEHAAEHDVLHRDVKPGNLLLDQHGNIHITDFGLAFSISASEEENKSNRISGTPSYIAPEVLDGEYTEKSEVYCLGLTLYELLTLQPAFEETHVRQLFERFKQVDKNRLSPRAIVPEISKDLDAIVQQATSIKPKERYANTADFAEDLSRYLKGYEVNARPISPVEKSWRWCFRNPLLASFIATVTSLLTIIAITMTVSYLKVEKSNDEVRAAAVRERAEREHAEVMLQTAVNALDNIYNRFAPATSLNYSEYSDSSDNQLVDGSTKIQPVLSNELALILEDLLTFYDRLAEEGGAGNRLTEASALSLGRVADIYRQLGNPEQAAGFYQEALAKLESCDKGQPRLKVESARFHNEIGRMLFYQGDMEAAQVSHQEALKLLQGVKQDEKHQNNSTEIGTSESAIFESVRAHYYLGRQPTRSASQVAINQLSRNGGPGLLPQDFQQGMMQFFGQFEPRHDQMDHLIDAINLIQSAPKEIRKLPNHQFLLAACYHEYSQLPGVPWFYEGFDHADDAILILQGLVKDYPQNPNFRYQLIQSMPLDRADPGQREPSNEYAIRELREALQHSTYLVNKHPNVPYYALSHMHVYHRLGHRLNREAEHWWPKKAKTLYAESKASILKADEVAKQLVERWPDVVSYQLWSITVGGSLAQVCLLNDEPDEANSYVDSSLAVVAELEEEKGLDSKVKQSLSGIRRALETLEKNTEVALQKAKPKMQAEKQE